MKNIYEKERERKENDIIWHVLYYMPNKFIPNNVFMDFINLSSY